MSGPIEKYDALLNGNKFLFVVCEFCPIPAMLLWQATNIAATNYRLQSTVALGVHFVKLI